jgi:hypothetical protein
MPAHLLKLGLPSVNIRSPSSTRSIASFVASAERRTAEACPTSTTTRAHALRERSHATFGGEELPVPVGSILEDLLGLAVEARELPVNGMLLGGTSRFRVSDEALAWRPLQPQPARGGLDVRVVEKITIGFGIGLSLIQHVAVDVAAARGQSTDHSRTVPRPASSVVLAARPRKSLWL